MKTSQLFSSVILFCILFSQKVFADLILSNPNETISYQEPPYREKLLNQRPTFLLGFLILMLRSYANGKLAQKAIVCKDKKLWIRILGISLFQLLLVKILYAIEIKITSLPFFIICATVSLIVNMIFLIIYCKRKSFPISFINILVFSLFTGVVGTFLYIFFQIFTYPLR